MLSTPVDTLGPFWERKQWQRAISERLNFNEINAFRGYDVTADPLSRLEIAAKLKKIKSCGNLVELRAAPGDLPTVHNFQKCGQTAVCPVCAARAQAMRKKRFGRPIEAMAGLCGAGVTGTLDRRAPRPARPVPHNCDPFPLSQSAPWPGITGRESFEGLNAYLVTATIRPRETLRDGLNHLAGAWKKFRLMGQRRGDARSRGEFGKVVGAIAKIEIKRGAGSGKWHPHIHALIFTRAELDFRFYDKGVLIHSKHFDPRAETVDKETGEVKPGKDILMSKISREWLKATGGDSYNIDVKSMRKFWESPYTDKRGVYHPSQKSRGVPFGQSVREQAAEVLKYATKWNADPEKGSAEFDAADFVEVVRSTYCRRLFSTYGYFRRIPGSDYVGNETGENLYWNIPGKPRPEIYAARWTLKGFSDLEKMPGPVFPDSDPLQSLINWETSPDGSPAIRENPRAIYLRAVVRINGLWRRRRSLVLKMKNRASMPIETERLLNHVRERATAELADARVILAPWYKETEISDRVMKAILKKYQESKEYAEKVTAAFMETLNGFNRTLAPA